MLIFLALFFNYVFTKEVYPDSKAPQKPRSLTGELYCNACQGIVRELLKTLRHRTNEADVIAATEKMCNLWNYVEYDYPPPNMQKACNAIIGDFSEDLEDALIHRYERETDIETVFCINITKACLDVSWEKVPGETARNERIAKEKERKKQEAELETQLSEQEIVTKEEL